MKLPRLPRKCEMIDAKYSPEQMREYAHRAIRDYLNESYKMVPVLTDVVEPQEKSIIEKIKESWT